MRLNAIMASCGLVVCPPNALAQAQPDRLLWRGATGEIKVTSCVPGGDHDDSCRALVAKTRDGEVQLGSGYIVAKLLWTAKGGRKEPAVLVLGDFGGSGGDADLFAVRFSPKLSFRKINGERVDAAAVRPGPGPLHFTLPFDIEFFNGASHAGAILFPLPMRWEKQDFAVDFAGLTKPTFSESEMAYRELAVSEELDAWAEANSPAPRLYPPEARLGTPVTVTAMLELIMSGHADQARALLDRSWPRDRARTDRRLGGEADFWAALCQALVRHPYWKRFALSRLQHADLIERGAAGKR